MFLTVFKVSKESLFNAENFVDFEDGDAMHKLLTGVLDSSRVKSGLLYRIISAKDAFFVYVQSNIKLESSRLRDFGMEEMAQFSLRMPSNGELIQYNLRCAPYSKKSGGRERTFIKGREERLSWVRKKLEAAGLKIKAIEEYENSDLIFTRGRRRVATGACSVRGSAVVVDNVALEKGIAAGFGQQKCFGTGLLLYK